MTVNQLRYWELQEAKRSNLAKELETNRSNIAKETETNRSNLAHEFETNRANLVSEAETARHNKRSEDINTISATGTLLRGVASMGSWLTGGSKQKSSSGMGTIANLVMSAGSALSGSQAITGISPILLG